MPSTAPIVSVKVTVSPGFAVVLSAVTVTSLAEAAFTGMANTSKLATRVKQSKMDKIRLFMTKLLSLFSAGRF